MNQRAAILSVNYGPLKGKYCAELLNKTLNEKQSINREIASYLNCHFGGDKLNCGNGKV